MNHLQWRALEQRHDLNQGLIDAARTLAAAHDEQRREVRLQAEFFKRCPAIDPMQTGPDRRAGELGLCSRKKRGALSKSEQNGANKTRSMAVCLSRNRVGLVNKGRHPTHPPRYDRCSGGKSPHPKHNLGVELAEDCPAQGEAFIESPDKRQNRR